MNQKQYLSRVLEKFGMSNCKPRHTPSEQKLVCNDDDQPLADATRYSEAVGSVVYAMMCTRPDISWAVTILSQHLSKPLETHWVALKHLFRYLQGTLDYELCYRKNDDGLMLIGYSDADWASSVHFTPHQS